MKYKKSLLALMVAASVTGLTACGGSSDSDDPAPPPTSGGTDPYLVSEWYNAGANNRVDIDPVLDANGMPTASSPELKGATYAFTASSPDLQDAAYAVSLGAPFTDVDYIGAFPQDTTNNWTDGWTIDLNGNATVWEPASGGTLAGAAPSADGSCPAGTTDIGNQALSTALGGGSMDICQLAAAYTTSGTTITLTNDNLYRLGVGFPGTKIGNGDVQDGDASNDVNVTLSIEPGTLILGESQEALIITRGSQLNAVGTAADPIVMTSKTQFDAWMAGGDGTSGRGEWAGLALMGYASTNECGSPCDVAAEGNIGYYGGSDDTDNSGTVQYVVVRHAGNDIDGLGNELNGFTLFGVGSGTTIDHVQVHKGLDDGIEHFGSTDFMSHIVLTANRDDSFDWGQGYRGGAQFVVIKQATDDADRGIEADNDGTNPEAVPVSKPTLANFTIMGQPGGDQSADGILLRRGTGAMMYNFIVTGFGDACIDVDGTATMDEATAGNLEINNSVVYCATGEHFESGDSDITGTQISDWFAAGGNNRTVDPNLQSNGMPNAVSGSGTGFVSTTYIGAFDPDGSNWTDGWTVGLNGNETVWEPASGGTLAGGTPLADDACPTGTTEIGDQAVTGGTMDVCQLAATYTSDGSTITLTNDNIYRLATGFPGTKIGNGEANDGDTSNDVSVKLAIEPGTLIVGDSQEALIITRGSSVEALGTAGDPIVMTSKTQFDTWMAGGDGTSGRGEWAGFALMGYAQTNECGSPCDVAAEGNIGYYGGSDDTDNSGIVQYVVIRHAGNDIDGQGNELNGFTLFGVGSGTTINHVQVHMGLDDGIEHFGSTDFMSYIVLTGNGDDSFDWGQGYRGGAQFVLVKQASDEADRAIEADNDGDNPDITPISMPTLANMTLMGDANGVTSADGILLRRGTGARIWNSIVTGFADACIDIDDEATFDRAGPNAPGILSGDLVMNNSIVRCTVNFEEE